MNNHLQYSKLREVMKIEKKKKKHNYVTKVDLNEICGAMVLAVLYTIIAQCTFSVAFPASVWLVRSRVSIMHLTR